MGIVTAFMVAINPVPGGRNITTMQLEWGGYDAAPQIVDLVALFAYTACQTDYIMF